MEPDFHHSQAPKKGYRILAGEFDPAAVTDTAIMESIHRYILRTGGRIAIGIQSTGRLALYRPVAELETIPQTERRIARQKLRQ